MHAQTFKNPEKEPISSCPWEAHVRLMKKNEEKSLLVSHWEWLPKAGWHPKGGCLFGIQIFFIILDHANACASMCSLVKIHNTGQLISGSNIRDLWHFFSLLASRHHSNSFWIHFRQWQEGCKQTSGKDHFRFPVTDISGQEIRKSFEVGIGFYDLICNKMLTSFTDLVWFPFTKSINFAIPAPSEY